MLVLIWHSNPRSNSHSMCYVELGIAPNPIGGSKPWRTIRFVNIRQNLRSTDGCLVSVWCPPPDCKGAEVYETSHQTRARWQTGVCTGCGDASDGKKSKLNLDMCHSTGKWMGYRCNPCDNVRGFADAHPTLDTVYFLCSLSRTSARPGVTAHLFRRSRRVMNAMDCSHLTCHTLSTTLDMDL